MDTPPAPPPTRPLLVLDLDDTLYRGVAGFPGRPPMITLRPGTAAFLTTVAAHYDLAVWTAASSAWMHAGLDAIAAGGFDLRAHARFTWHRDHCGVRRYEDDDAPRTVKPARRFGRQEARAYPKTRILVVDDDPSNFRCGYGHLVRVRPWTGARDDAELAQLAPYLVSIAGERDLTRLEKRGWRRS